MQELQDRYLDDCILRGLRTENVVTPQQQQRAWDNLRRRAEKQAILPPLAPPLQTSVWKKLRVWGKARFIGLYHVVLDDTPYRRAQNRYPTMMSHRRPYSTFASAEFMLPA